MRNDRDTSSNRDRTQPSPLLRHVGRSLLAVVATVAPWAAHAQASEPAAGSDEAFYQRAAVCAAAMQVDQYAFVARARAGATDVRPELEHISRLGFTYVGTAYLKGLRNPRADEMLKAQVAEQKSWDAAHHQRVVAECRAEAEVLFTQAGSMQQWLVTNRASKRVDKFLAASNPTPSASSASH